jgi:tetrahydromethanopterin S-methyltransferase subunit G
MNLEQDQPGAQDWNQLSDRLDTLERKLDLILLKLDGSVIKNRDKMGNHIDFVNGVYATVKVPLSYIANKIHNIANPLGSHQELPLISVTNKSENNFHQQ